MQIVVKAVLSVMLVIFVVAGLYVAYAYYAYNRVPPLERACVDCTTAVTVNGYNLYYREVGADKGLPPVVLVHGGPGHSSLSFKQSFDFLADQTRVIYYDQRGSGNSQIKQNPEDYTVEQLVEELETLRRDVVKADKIHLVGHSFGSAIVQRYAIKHPEHVAKLVIVGGVRINNGLSSHFIWKWFGPAMYATVLGFPPADAQAADDWSLQSAEADNLSRLFDKSNAAILEDTGTMTFAPWREISLSAAGPDYTTELGQLQTPLLFLYGVADSPYTGRPVADALCALLLNCQSVEFAQSGHWPFLEEPTKFQQVLQDFLLASD